MKYVYQSKNLISSSDSYDNESSDQFQNSSLKKITYINLNGTCDEQSANKNCSLLFKAMNHCVSMNTYTNNDILDI